jgi:hypothetical protein
LKGRGRLCGIRHAGRLSFDEDVVEDRRRLAPCTYPLSRWERFDLGALNFPVHRVERLFSNPYLIDSLRPPPQPLNSLSRSAVPSTKRGGTVY